MDMTKRFCVATLMCLAIAASAPMARASLATAVLAFDEDRADELYEEGREAIEEGKYDRAVDRFTKLIELKSSRTDAALYWKSYSLAKLGQPLLVVAY